MMKRYIIVFVFLAFAKAVTAQSTSQFPKIATLDVSYMNGTILEHNPDICHLITDHPTGILLSYNRKTFGEEEWQSRFGFPDWGFSAAYQDMKTYELGEAYSAY
ncbi:MAG: acyloxyacyl hydrolase, partial [Nonlabens ulvanivorans]